MVFALNSSLHSYLILAFTSAERVTMDVGFYYMANAAGRLIGTLLSGLSYQIGGLPLCLATAGVMAGSAGSALAASPDPDPQRKRGHGISRLVFDPNRLRRGARDRCGILGAGL